MLAIKHVVGIQSVEVKKDNETYNSGVALF